MQEVIINPPVSDLEDFCKKCQRLNFNNNSSLLAMKYEWCLNTGGQWWAVYRNQEIVSVAGAHPFKEGYRLLFRGVQTMPATKALSKKHLTSMPWSLIMPNQITWASGVITQETPAYITTNVSHDESGKMNRTHRVLQLLKKQNIVDYCGDEEIYHTMQSIWRLNIGEYFETLD